MVVLWVGGGGDKLDGGGGTWRTGSWCRGDSVRYKGTTLLIALNVSRRIEDWPLSTGGVGERGAGKTRKLGSYVKVLLTLRSGYTTKSMGLSLWLMEQSHSSNWLSLSSSGATLDKNTRYSHWGGGYTKHHASGARKDMGDAGGRGKWYQSQEVIALNRWERKCNTEQRSDEPDKSPFINYNLGTFVQ